MVRRQALRIAEPIASEEPKVLEAAAKLADDPDPKVRLQLAFSWRVGRAAGGAALAQLALRGDRTHTRRRPF